MAEKVEAVVVEENDGLSVTFSPATLSANFEALNNRVDEILKVYENATFDINDENQVKQAKKERAYLNGMYKELDERRKAIKREYEKPLKDFEVQVSAVTSKIKKVSSEIDTIVKEAEQIAKDNKFNQLKEYYEEFAELLVPVVPYERIANEKWLNKSFKLDKAKEELEAKVEKIASDWESLKKLNLDFYDMAEAHFFEHLDLGEAVKYNDKLVADRQKIEQLKEDMAYCQEPIEEPIEEPEPVIEQAIEEPVEVAPQAPPVKPAPPIEQEVSCSWVIVIDSATRSQAIEIGKILGERGITGVFKRGTLYEVYQREAGACYV